MKKTLFVSGALAAILSLAALIRPSLDPSPLTRPRPQREAFETKDDPLARIRFEFLKLRDPVTGTIPANARTRDEAFAARMPHRRAGGGGAAGEVMTSSWTFRGPGNVGGRTRALAVDMSDPTYHTLLAGGVSGGIWRSTDDGASWEFTSGTAGFIGATCIVQDLRAGHMSTWYHGTGEFIGNSAGMPESPHFGQGIFKSTDGGRSWTQLASTVEGSPVGFDNLFDFVYNVAIDPSNAAQEEIYAATIGGIQRSTDGGASWTLTIGTANNPTAYYTDVAVTTDGVAYATLDSGGPTKGVFRSIDGITWTDITPAGLGASYERMVVEVVSSDEDIVYLLASGTGTASHHSLYKYTYLSGDGSGAGGTWEDRSAHLLNFTVSPYQPEKNFNSQGGYDLLLAVKPDNPNIVLIGGIDLFRSTDAFTTDGNRAWIGGWLYPTTQNQEQHADQHALVFSPADPRVVYSGSDGGVWKTADVTAAEVHWTSLNNGYQTTQFYTLALDHAAPGDETLIGGLQDNGTWWTDDPTSATPWITQFGGDGAHCAIANGASAGGNYYLSAQMGWVYRVALNASGQQSATDWTRVDPSGVNENQYWFVNPFVLDPNDSRIMYLATDGVGVWRNSNLTQIPPQSNDPAQTNWVHLTGSEHVSILEVSKTPPNILYFGAYPSKMYKVTGANTAPAGTAPVEITDPGFPADSYVSAISVDPTDGQRVLISFSNYGVVSLFYTTDGGGSWSTVEGNLGGATGPSVRAVAILPTSESGRAYFAGTSAGLYSTSVLNGAATIWQQEGPDAIGSLIVDAVVSRDADRLVAIATHGGGVYSATVETGTPECATRAGDANGNNEVDVLDLVSVVNDILQTIPLGEGARACADMDGSGTIEVLDLVQIVNVILNPGMNRAPLRAGSEETLEPVAWAAREEGASWRLRVDGSRVGGLQMRLRPDAAPAGSGAPLLRGASDQTVFTWSATDRGWTLLAYNPGGGSLADGWITLDLPVGTARTVPFAPEDLVLSDPQGRPLRLDERAASPEPFGGQSVHQEAVLTSIAPNPAVADATVRFRLAEDGRVDLSIFDASGRLVRSLASGWRAAGPHSVVWDGKDDAGRIVSGGVYFVRLRAGKSTETLKLPLIRR